MADEMSNHNFSENEAEKTAQNPPASHTSEAAGRASGYSNDIPGPTKYDQAKPFNAPAASMPPQGAPRPESAPGSANQNPSHTANFASVPQAPYRTPEKHQNRNKAFALASLVLGIASIAFLLLLPLIGIPFAAVSGVLGLIFGIISRKGEKEAYALAGLIVSIAGLAFTLLYIIMAAIFGSAIFAIISNMVQSSEIPRYGDGFYYYFD